MTISRSTDIGAALAARRSLALRARQRGFLLDPYRFASGAPSSTTDPYAANRQLLLHFDGSNNGTTITDHGLASRTVTATGSAVTSTTQAQFGATSLKTVSSGDYVEVGASYLSGLNPGSGDFSIEFWYYYPDINAFTRFFDATPGGHANRFYFAKYPGAHQLYVQAPTTGDIGPFNASGLTVGAWNHICWSRVSGTARFFVGGSSVYSGSDSATYSIGTTAVRIGGDFGGSYTSYLDEFGVAIGAGPTSGFTPASLPYAPP